MLMSLVDFSWWRKSTTLGNSLPLNDANLSRYSDTLDWTKLNSGSWILGRPFEVIECMVFDVCGVDSVAVLMLKLMKGMKLDS